MLAHPGDPGALTAPPRFNKMSAAGMFTDDFINNNPFGFWLSIGCAAVLLLTSVLSVFEYLRVAVPLMRANASSVATTQYARLLLSSQTGVSLASGKSLSFVHRDVKHTRGPRRHPRATENSKIW